jgi:hypothetical protein
MVTSIILYESFFLILDSIKKYTTDPYSVLDTKTKLILINDGIRFMFLCISKWAKKNIAQNAALSI